MTQVASLAEWDSLHAKAGNKAVRSWQRLQVSRCVTLSAQLHHVQSCQAIPWTTQHFAICIPSDVNLCFVGSCRLYSHLVRPMQDDGTSIREIES